MEEAPISISVITPCFNHGLYIDEAIESVKIFKSFLNVEHLIVNDGSTDTYTIDKLKQLSEQGYIIIDQPNGGPANARNTALQSAKGKYILPLDSDNRVNAKTFVQAFDLMEKDLEIDVVYTNAQRFGSNAEHWEPGEIDPVKLLAGNYIDTCSLLRKETLIESGGYDDKIPVYGNEDWELWLRYFFEDRKFYWLRETGFEYRVADTSLSRSESAPHQDIINNYMVRKYSVQYANYYQYLYAEKTKLQNLKAYLGSEKLKSIAKIIFNKPVIRY